MTKYDKTIPHVIDTNTLLSYREFLEKMDAPLVFTTAMSRELENLELKYKANSSFMADIRAAKRFILDFKEKYSGRFYANLNDYSVKFDGLSADYVDNILLQIALDEGYGLVTADALLEQKAREFGIKSIINPLRESFRSSDEDDAEYEGYITVHMTQNEVMEIYREKLGSNPFGLLVNQYVIIRDLDNRSPRQIMKETYEAAYATSEHGIPYDLLEEIDAAEENDSNILDAFVLNKDGFMESVLYDSKSKLKKYNFKSKFFGEFKPLDIYQKLVLDAYNRAEIVQVRGGAGSGKSKIAIEKMFADLESGEIEQIIIFGNPAPAKDAQELGFYKGDKIDKLLQSSVGSTLKGKFPDEMDLRLMFERGKILLMPFVDLRGYDTGDRHVAIWVVEAQNTTAELLKMGIQRGGKNSKFYIDGDHTAQVDRDAYNYKNGMRRLSQVARGSHLFSEVVLKEIRRSEKAKLVDKM